MLFDAVCPAMPQLHTHITGHTPHKSKLRLRPCVKAHFEDEQRECVKKDVATDGPALVLREDVARADSCGSPSPTQHSLKHDMFIHFY